MLISIGIWWVYFDFIARRAAKPSIYAALLWVYWYLLLMTCITMTGVGIFAVISDLEHGLLSASSRLLLTAGAAFTLILIGLLETTLHRKEDEPTHPWVSPIMKVITGLILLLIGVSVVSLDVTPLLLLIVVGFTIQMIYGTTAWYTQEI